MSRSRSAMGDAARRAVTWSRRAIRLGLTCMTAVGAAVSAHTSFAVSQAERQTLIDLYNATGGDNWINHTGWLGASGTECNWYGVTCAGGHVALLSLSGDNLTGTLPDLSAFTELQGIWLVDNHLSGQLPDLTSLTKLLNLIVRGNLLSGQFPSWSPLAPIAVIDAGDNAFIGSIPDLSGTPTLSGVKFDGNWFTGSIPDISNLSKLVDFEVDGNQLTGTIPPPAGHAFLKTFTVSGNALTGSVPSTAGANVLQVFDVSNNQLTGSLPASYPTTLQKFLASNNQLSGAMTSLGSTQLQVFRVDGNAQLSGQVGGAPPNTLLSGSSALCPSGLTSSNDSQTNIQWNTATGHVPWDYVGACAQQPVNAVPDLKILKTHVGHFSQGQQGAIYSLTVQNGGPGVTVGQVTVSDVLPAAFTATAINGQGWSCTLATTTCTRSDVLPGGSSYPAIVLTVDVALGAPANVINTATVAGGGETDTANDTAADPTTIDGSGAMADLTLTKSHVGDFMQGQIGAVYTLTANNVGGSATSGLVTVTDTLPSALTANQMSGHGWNCDVSSVSCTRSDPLAAGASFPPIALTVDVAANALPSVVNAAQVSGGGETNLGNDSASDPTNIAVAMPDVVLTKFHGGNFVQGQTGVAYNLSVSNAGTKATVGTVTVTDTLPSSLIPVAMSGQNWTCNPQTVTCTRSDPLAGGASYESIVLTVNVASDAPPGVVNTANVSGGGEVNTGNDTATDPTTINTASADMLLSVSHTGDFTQGQTGATYHLVAYNDGFATSSGPVTVVDTLPAGLTATSINGSGWACDLQTVSCMRNDPFPVGGWASITLVVDVAAGAPSILINTANVSGGGEADTTNDTASDPTTIDPASAGPDLTVSKTHIGDFRQGQTGASYTLVAYNIGGSATAGAVTVTDTLPQLPHSLTATSLSGSGWSCDLPTLTCTRSDPLAPNASYPAITLLVDVAANTGTSVLNVATVGGGGEANTANDMAVDYTDVTPVLAAPVVSKSFVPDHVIAGDQAGSSVMTIALTNSDKTTAITGVTFTDNYPVPLHMANASIGAVVLANTCGGTLTAVANGTSVALAGGVIPANDSCFVNIRIAGTSAGISDNHTGTVTSDNAMDGADAVGTLTVTSAANQSQTISFTSTSPTGAVVLGPGYPPSATATSGLPVTLTIDATSAAVCAIDLSGNVSFIGPGSCTIDANQHGDATYMAAPQVQQTFAVASAGGTDSQFITFTSTQPANAVVGGATYLATATASSGLPVVLTVDAAAAMVCTIDNSGDVTFIGAGTCTIDANQGGDATYAPASQVTQAFAVAQAGGTSSQAITFTSVPPANAIVGGAGYLATATANSGLPVQLTIDGTSANVCTIDSGMVSFIGPGECTLDANQGGNANYSPAPQVQQSFIVAIAGGTSSQTITFTSTAPVDAAVNGPTYLATAMATSDLPVILTIDGSAATVCAINDGTVSFIGPGTCVIDANQGGNADYAPASQVRQEFEVATAGGSSAQSISFTSTAPIDAVVGGIGYFATAAATSNLPVLLTIDAASATVCTASNSIVSFIGSGDCTIDANQGGDASFAPAPQAQQTFPVASAGGVTLQTITFISTAPVDGTVDGPSYLAVATATSGLPVVLTIDAISAAECSINNGTVSFTGEGTCTIDANQGGDSDFAAASQVQQMVNVGLASGDLIFRDGFDHP